MDNLVVPVGGMDSVTLSDIPTVVIVDWENSDCWRMGLLVGIGLDLDYSGTPHFHRIGAASVDRDRTVDARGKSRGLKLAVRDSQDCWNRDFVVALGSGTGYPERELFRRIVAAAFDRDHTVVESSLEKMDIPGKGDSLVRFGCLGWGTPFVDIRPFERKD
jgi:hypothetical protein